MNKTTSGEPVELTEWGGRFPQKPYFPMYLANGGAWPSIWVILATLLGLFVGIVRLSPNWLARNVAYGYVEIVRNVPVLLQLFFCLAVIALAALRLAIFSASCP